MSTIRDFYAKKTSPVKNPLPTKKQSPVKKPLPIKKPSPVKPPLPIKKQGTCGAPSLARNRPVKKQQIVSKIIKNPVGRAILSCDEGFTNCNGPTCVDLTTSITDCGYCGNNCIYPFEYCCGCDGCRAANTDTANS